MAGLLPDVVPGYRVHGRAPRPSRRVYGAQHQKGWQPPFYAGR